MMMIVGAPRHAQYPTRDHYLAMGAHADYRAVASSRHEALRATYILSVVPEYVDREPPPAPPGDGGASSS